MSSAPRIILASRSPARRKLMTDLGVPFECHASEIYEDMDAIKDPLELAVHLATAKAEAVRAKYPNSIIIGVDTFLVIGSEKIGKPESIKDAERIIKKMSGQKIEVISGIAAIKTDAKGNTERELVSNATTILKIKKMSREEILFLANHEQALQISGGFSIEGEGGKMVEEIEGDFNNVIGLPIIQLKEMLLELGVKNF